MKMKMTEFFSKTIFLYIILVDSVKGSISVCFNGTEVSPGSYRVTSVATFEKRLELFCGVCESSSNCKCEIEYISAGPIDVQWFKNDKKLYDRGDMLRFENHANVLAFKSAASTDVGDYRCSIKRNKEKKVATVAFKVMMWPHAWIAKDSKDAAFNENFKMDITCLAVGYPVPYIKWTRDGNALNTSDHRVQFREKNGVKNSRLIIPVALLSDAGEYYCSAVSEIGVSETAKTIVRVRDKNKAWYPFLAMVGEVCVLLIIIHCFTSYKDRRAQRLAEQANVDPYVGSQSLSEPTSEEMGLRM